MTLGKVSQGALLGLAFVIGLAACAGPSPTATPTSTAAPADPQADALTDYFAALHERRFEDAAALYGGAYDILQDMNPDVDPADHAALFERHCTQNGGVCLPLAAIVARGVAADGAALFMVHFANDDGSIFGQGPVAASRTPERGGRSSLSPCARSRASFGRWSCRRTSLR